MARLVVVGARISGHTVAAFLRKWLAKDDAVTIVSLRPEQFKLIADEEVLRYD